MMRFRIASVPFLVLLLGLIFVTHCFAQANPLDLTGMTEVFSEDFHQFSVSATGQGTRWMAHTPWGGDFGDARFVDPVPGFPFGTDDGVFRIEMRKTSSGAWESGLISSLNRAGEGFGLQYGYFEMRAKLPAGPGVWPAFWLDSMPPKGSADPSIEIDVMEHYGKFPGAFNSTVTVWPKGGGATRRSMVKINEVNAGTLSHDFHTYGALVDHDFIRIYLDRIEVWRVPTPTEHRHPLGILVDLGLGSGWPITKTPNPSYMYVDYVKAYRTK